MYFQENDLKKALKIKYVGEEGLDLGGLQKEFFHIIINDILKPGECNSTYLSICNLRETANNALIISNSTHHLQQLQLFTTDRIYNSSMNPYNLQSKYSSDYGMFTYLKEVERMWINCSSLESDILFELVGTLLGIAIYNGIILDLHFPPVIYKKLQGCKTDLNDLKDVEPSLEKSLKSLLEYDGDVESTFCYTFQVNVGSEPRRW